MVQCPWQLTVVRHSFWSSRAACAAAFIKTLEPGTADSFLFMLGPETQQPAIVANSDNAWKQAVCPTSLTQRALNSTVGILHCVLVGGCAGCHGPEAVTHQPDTHARSESYRQQNLVGLTAVICAPEVGAKEPPTNHLETGVQTQGEACLTQVRSIFYYSWPCHISASRPFRSLSLFCFLLTPA